MTTHEFATFIDHLRIGFSSSLKATAITDLEEVVSVFREQPDQTLKALMKSIRPQAAGDSARPRTNATAPVDLLDLISKMEAIRDGSTTPTTLNETQFNKMKNDMLETILGHFGSKKTGTKAEKLNRIVELLQFVPPKEASASPTITSSPEEEQAICEGVELYVQLRDNRTLSIGELQAGFQPFRSYPKATLLAIVRRVGFSVLDGSREHILEKLLSDLEVLKMSQHKGDRIMNGTSA